MGYVATEASFQWVYEAESRNNEINCTAYLLHWTFISASTQAHQLWKVLSGHCCNLNLFTFN